MLLRKSEEAKSPKERAESMAEIGQLYEQELDDKEQALVAYTQAYCEDPLNLSYAEQVERLYYSAVCWGDFNHDGAVDLIDLAQVLSNYGMTSGATYSNGDMDGDGDVDLADLAALLGVYGVPCD